MQIEVKCEFCSEVRVLAHEKIRELLNTRLQASIDAGNGGGTAKGASKGTPPPSEIL
jgi:hypothetical protein